MLWIHIAGGLAALLAGFVALYARKGGERHRGWGRVFGYAMFVMTLSGVVVASVLRPNPGNVLVAGVTFYLVASGWLAVRPGPNAAPKRHAALCGFGFIASVYGLGVAAVAFQAPGMEIKGIPAVGMVIFSLIALLGAASDIRVLRGHPVTGSSRLLRHLWRMGLALWIAAVSFFLGQADEFPEAVRHLAVLSIPVLLVTGTLIYWVARQLLAGRRANPVRLKGMAAASVPARQ